MVLRSDFFFAMQGIEKQVNPEITKMLKCDKRKIEIEPCQENFGSSEGSLIIGVFIWSDSLLK